MAATIHEVLPSTKMSPAELSIVDRSDERPFRFGHHAILARLWNRSTGRDGGKSSATARSQLSVNAVPVQVRAELRGGGESLARQVQQRQEIVPRKIAIGPRAAQFLKQVILRTIVAGHRRDDLLEGHVERRFGDFQLIEPPVTDRS